MAEKRKTIRIAKKKVRVKSKKKVAPLSKQQSFHISKSTMSWMINKPIENYWWELESEMDLNEL